MAGAKGYRSYRGRGTKRKILLALLLCLVILAAVMVILVQEHVVFDANGTPRLEIPWQKEEPEQTPELDLVIEEPEAPWQVRAYQVTTAPLTVEGWGAGTDEGAGLLRFLCGSRRRCGADHEGRQRAGLL